MMKGTLVFLAVLAFGCAAPQPKTLADDFQDILAVIDVEGIRAIIRAHLETDGAATAVLAYLQGPEWAALVAEVASKPAVQDLVVYLTDAGIPVAEIVQAIHDLIASLVGGTPPDATGSLRPLLDEIEATLDVQAILDVVNDKLANSPFFQDFYTKISSEKARTLVEEVRAIEEVQRIAQVLRDMGVKVDEALAWIYAFLGWGSP